MYRAPVTLQITEYPLNMINIALHVSVKIDNILRDQKNLIYKFIQTVLPKSGGVHRE